MTNPDGNAPAPWWQRLGIWLIVPTCLLVHLLINFIQQTPAFVATVGAGLLGFIVGLVLTLLKVLTIYLPIGLVFFRLAMAQRLWVSFVATIGVTLFLLFGMFKGMFSIIDSHFLYAGLIFGLLSSALIASRAASEQGRTMVGVLLGCLAAILFIGTLPVGLLAFFDVFLTQTSPERVAQEIPAPDEKHSILITEQTTTIFIDDHVETRYKIATPGGLFRQVNQFYSQDGYPGENPLDFILHDIRWVDNEHVAYGSGAQTKYCNINKLYNLEDCTSEAPKAISLPKQATIDEKLVAAAEQGKLAEVQDLLRGGAHVNYRTPFKNTALLKAAEKGHLPVANLLLNAGAEVNTENSLKQTVLSVAIEGNHPEVVQRLLLAKASMRAPDFSMAVSKGFTKVVGLLLDAGADPNYLDGDSPIIIDAIVRGNTNIVRLLLDKGAKVNARTNSTGGTPLMYAALWGHEDIVKLLLDRGADPNAKDKVGRTALSEVIDGVGRTTKAPNQKIIQLLTAKGASVNASGGTASALVTAAEKGDLQLVQSLIAKGAKVNDTDENGRTPLMGAATFSRNEIAEILIKKGADVNAWSSFGETALQISARERNPEMCEMLLKAGAKVNARIGQNKGTTALDWVVKDGTADVGRDTTANRDATYQVLRKYGGKTGKEL